MNLRILTRGLQIVPTLIILILSTACLPIRPLVAPTVEIIPSPSPTLRVQPTPTTVWFPPTSTFTPYPTLAVTPTPELLTGIGEVIFSDDFSSGEAWSLGRTAEGSVALGKNELTIAISTPRAYMFSYRNAPILDNFYAEITASPTLCKDLDEYGMLIRFNPPSSYYRFSLSCDGQVRLDRILSGSASSPQTWIPSGAVPPGAPSTSRLGVWALGEELRLFVNNEFQFSITDPTLSSGTLGVFARSAGENVVTVNFSDLVAYQVTP